MPGIRYLPTVIAYSLLVAGCVQHKPLTLMPTPLLYETGEVEPFQHLAAPLKTPTTQVFYATTRRPMHRQGQPAYGNGVDDFLHLGTAQVHIGEPGITWDEVVRLSLNNTRENAPALTVADVTHWGSLEHRELPAIDWEEESHARFIREVESEIVHHDNREIMVYVHGTATNFEHGVAMTGEIDHFSGRDFVGVAFLWPSHENIFHYVLREDVRRARHSSEALADLLVLLASETSARRINIVSWSAGGRVVSKALHELRDRHADLDAEALGKRFRLGAVLFAAADVETDRFLERLPSVSDLSEQVVITLSDADDALNLARRFMGGPGRTGSNASEDAELAFLEEHSLPNVELIDVSLAKEQRGFDITGHHYWYRNPWSSSDLVLLLRTLLPPEERGLYSAPHPGLWYLGPQYPERVREVSREAFADDRMGGFISRPGIDTDS